MTEIQQSTNSFLMAKGGQHAWEVIKCLEK